MALKAPHRFLIDSDSIHGLLKNRVLLNSNSLNRFFGGKNPILNQKNEKHFFSESISRISQLDSFQIEEKLLFPDSIITDVLRLSEPGVFGLKYLDKSNLPASIHIESKNDFLGRGMLLLNNELSGVAETELLQFNKLEMEGLGNEAHSNIYHSISKRVVSLKDRNLLDSSRNLVAYKLYRIKEFPQDSLDVFLIAEKEKIKDNLFFEGLVNLTKDYDNFSVSDFSGSMGLRLTKLYEIGAGPEIGISDGDFSAIGARLFARRHVFEDRLFAVVENSVGRNIPMEGDKISFDGMISKWKIGAGTLFNLSPSGKTKLNFQTLLNPQYLKGGYSNLIDFRFGISKLQLMK